MTAITIGGLAVSTILALVVIPVIYRLVDDLLTGRRTAAPAEGDSH